jgi:hypothetical protein
MKDLGKKWFTFSRKVYVLLVAYRPRSMVKTMVILLTGNTSLNPRWWE